MFFPVLSDIPKRFTRRITRFNSTLYIDKNKTPICITNNLLEKGNDASKMKLLER